MATLSTRSMDVFDFVGVVEVPTIVSVVDEHFYYYPHVYHPSVTGVTHFLTASLLKSALFTTVCVTMGGIVFKLLLMISALNCKGPYNMVIKLYCMTCIGLSHQCSL